MVRSGLAWGIVKTESHLRSRALFAGLAMAVLVTLGRAAHELWEVHRRQALIERAYAPPPPGMVLVPAGYFLMGSDDPEAEPDEKPLRRVFVPAFYIDRHEVTNARYREFKPDHGYPPGAEDLPVSFVLKEDAEAFARAAGKRLPTGAEWEKAARGTDGRVYPWGNVFEAARANVRALTTNELGVACLRHPDRAAGDDGGKQPVGRYPTGASPYGCQDMSGNVWEWVSDDWFDRNAWGRRAGERRSVIRGGAYAYSDKQARASYQGFEGVGATCNDVGFRCAMDARPVWR